MLFLGITRRCPNCLAAWTFSRRSWLFRAPLAFVMTFEVALLFLIGFGWRIFLIAVVTAATLTFVPFFLPVELRTGDPITERAVLRWKNREHPWSAA